MRFRQQCGTADVRSCLQRALGILPKPNDIMVEMTVRIDCQTTREPMKSRQSKGTHMWRELSMLVASNLSELLYVYVMHHLCRNSHAH